MNKTILLLAMFAQTTLASFVTAAQTNHAANHPENRPTIRFAPLPMVSKTEVYRQFLPFAHYLESVAAQTVELIYHDSYQSLLDDLTNDRIDLAYLGPLPYVLLQQQPHPFLPLVRFLDEQGNPDYTCCLIRFDQSIADLNTPGAGPIALTQPYSTCGYLMTYTLLQRYQLELDTLPFYYAQKHSSCCTDVVRGTAALAGVKTAIAHQYQNLGVQIIAESDPLPGFLLIANPRTLRTEVIERLQNALLQLDPRHNRADAKITHNWGSAIRYGAIAVENEDYQPIQRLLDNVQIPGVAQ